MLTLTSPIDIWAHRIPVGPKLAALAAGTAVLFALNSPAGLLPAAGVAAALIASGGRTFALTSVRMLRPLVPFILIVALWHLATDAQTEGATILLRMVTAVAAANFVTMTTRLSDMIATLQRLGRPLASVGLRPRTLAIAIALTIRFIPVMLTRMDTIRFAWRARSARKPGWRILMPLTLAALDDADQTAEALRARGGIR